MEASFQEAVWMRAARTVGLWEGDQYRLWPVWERCDISVLGRGRPQGMEKVFRGLRGWGGFASLEDI